MKNFTGKVTNVDNNGNPIKKKSTGKNGKKSGFKKPAAVKKSSGKKPLKDITAVMTKKPVRKSMMHYYFFDEERWMPENCSQRLAKNGLKRQISGRN